MIHERILMFTQGEHAPALVCAHVSLYLGLYIAGSIVDCLNFMHYTPMHRWEQNKRSKKQCLSHASQTKAIKRGPSCLPAEVPDNLRKAKLAN